MASHATVQRLAKQLRSVRLERGLTLQDVASIFEQRTGKPTSDKSINAYEVGRRTPSVEVLEGWAMALDLRLMCYLESRNERLELVEADPKIAHLLRRIANAKPEDIALFRSIVDRIL